MAKKNLKKTANELLKNNPKENKVFMTQDGQGFFIEGYAKNNARDKSLEDPEVFFREGYSDDNDSDLEEVLEQTEEKLQVAETTLEKVIDISNVEAEETPEANEKDHAAVKGVIELREKYTDVVNTLAEASTEIKTIQEFQTSVVELIKGNDTKLAEAIKGLLPVETEE